MSSYDALGSFMFGPIGLVLAGPAAIAIGGRPTLVACAVIVALTAFGALLAAGVRNLRAPEPGAVGRDDAGTPIGVG